MEYLYIICWDEYIEWSKKSSGHSELYAKNVEQAISLVKKEFEWDVVIVSIYREEIQWLE